MNFFNQNKDESGLKSLSKKKKMIKILIPVVLAFLGAAIFIVAIAAIASPAFFFVEKTSDWFTSIKNFLTGSTKDFSHTIETQAKKKKSEDGVEINKELVMSVLFYESGLDFSGDYTVSDECDIDDSTTCIDKETNKRLSRNAKQLVNGMVKTEYRWTCRHYEEVTTRKCTSNNNSNSSNTIKEEVSKINSNLKTYLLNIAMNTTGTDGSGGGSNSGTSGKTCTIITEPKYSNWIECGYTKEESDETTGNAMCAVTCSPELETNVEEETNLKTKEEYTTWLKLSSSEKDEYGDKGYDLASKLEEDGAILPEDEAAREAYLEQVIEDIYDIYSLTKTTEYSYGDFPSLNYTSGTFNGTIYSWDQCDKSYADSLGNQIIPGNNRTYCSGGCALASTAAIISSLSGSEVNPVTIGNKYGDSDRCVSGGCFGFDIVKAAAADYGFSTSIWFDGSNTAMLQTMVNSLAQGNSLVMVRVDAGSISSGGHFIVLTGVNEDGSVTMVDSGRLSNNDKSWTLEEVAKSATGYMIVSR